MGCSAFLLVDLEGTIWHNTPEIESKRRYSRAKLLSSIYGIDLEVAYKSLEHLDEIIRRYKRHFKIPSPEKQIEILLSYIGLPLKDTYAFYNAYFEVLLDHPPKIDYAFLSALETIKRELAITIGGYVLMPHESEKFIKEYLSISGFLHLFDSIMVGSNMTFIPPSPLAFIHIPPPGTFHQTIGISSNTSTLKSLVLAGYNHIFQWNIAGDETGVFDVLKDYSEIIVKITNL